jgi:F-type H+-transporting ATPase subunit b
VRRASRRFMRRLLAAVRVLALACAALTVAPALASASEGEKVGEAVAAEQGSEGGEPAPRLDVKRLALQLLNFAVLAGILGWFGGKAINKALLARHLQLKADLVAAAEARSSAELRVAEQGKRLASLEGEIAAMRAGIKQEAEDEKQRLIAAAEERATRIGDETKFLLDQQVKEAEATLKREVAEAAVRIAEQLVTKAFNAGDQQRLVDTFVTDVAGGAPAGRGA